MNSKQRAAMQQALEALEALKKAINDEDGWVLNAEKTIKNLEDLIADEWYENLLWGEALAQPQDNLNCKSVQRRLATSWGYVRKEEYDMVIEATKEKAAKIADAELMNTNMLTSYPPKSSAAWNIATAIRRMK